MRTILLYSLTLLFVCCISNQVIAQKSTDRKNAKVNVVEKTTPKTVNKTYSSEAEKYAADGMTAPKKKGQTTSAKKKGASDYQLPYNNTVPTKSGSAANAGRCGTDQHQANRQRSAGERELIQILSAAAAARIDNFIPCDGSNTIVIPVAVHYDASYDCSNTQCLIDAALNNIATLNEDFAALNADIAYYNSLNAACPAGYPLDVVSDGTCMQFCLATQNHPAAEGISDGEPAITIGLYNHSAVGGGGAPPWAGYANIFIATGTGLLGVADAPGLGNGDGVLVDSSTWGGRGLAPCTSGSTVNDNATYNLGRTLTHEFGHYFDLFHTFQGGCGDGDTGTFSGQVGVITDTPATANPFFGCPTVTSCADAPASGCASMYAQITNYMDYTDDACMVMFSQDQAAVMNGWANGLAFVDNATTCGGTMPTSLAACQLTAAFNPPNNSDIVICTDDGTTIQFEDLSTNGPVSWDWTFTVTGGDITLSSGASTMQNPAPMVTGGTSGTIDVTLSVMNADGTTESVTQSYTITLVSGDACPNECDYTLELTDSFGDGWNGATLEVLSNGVPVAGSPFGNSFTTGTSEINTITLTDGETITFDQTNGGFPTEEGFIITDPFGNVIFNSGPGVGAGVVYTFDAYCSAPTCDDGLQNGEEAGVDCGGTSPCPDCCSNGIQDDDETGIDCGGLTCAPCPACPDDFTEIINETFDTCAQPADWTVTATDGGTGDITFNEGPTLVPGGGTPSPDFSGCIAIIDDDANDAIGVGCVISPVIDLTFYINTSLTFDWQNNDFAGTGDFVVEVYDGTMWVQVFIEEEDNFGTNQTVSLDAYANPNFQIRFCYDDEGGFAWGAGFDNVSVCGQPNDMCPTEVIVSDVSGDYCDGSTESLTATGNPNVTYAWSSSNPAVVLSSPDASSTDVAMSASTACTVESAEISLVVVCTLDGVELYNDVVSTVNVYPAAPATPADLEALLTFNAGTCMEPVTVSVGCEDFVTLTPDAANPSFPVNMGEMGTANYTATYTNTPACCPDVSGATTDVVIDGSFEAGAGGGAWTEASTNFGSPICDLGSCGTGTGTGPSDGDFWAWFGGISASEVGSVCQSITVPAGIVSLDLIFDLETIICDSPSDFMEATVDGTQVFFVDGASPTCGVLGYATQTIDLLAAGFAGGASYTLCFESEIFAVNGGGTNFFVDNIQVLAEQPPGVDPCVVDVSGDYACEATEEVPTVGEWGLIILGLLMSIVAVVGIRERKFATRRS